MKATEQNKLVLCITSIAGGDWLFQYLDVQERPPCLIICANNQQHDEKVRSYRKSEGAARD